MRDLQDIGMGKNKWKTRAAVEGIQPPETKT